MTGLLLLVLKRGEDGPGGGEGVEKAEEANSLAEGGEAFAEKGECSSGGGRADNGGGRFKCFRKGRKRGEEDQEPVEGCGEMEENGRDCLKQPEQALYAIYWKPKGEEVMVSLAMDSCLVIERN